MTTPRIEEMVEEVMSFMENDFATGETSWTDTRTFFTKALTQVHQAGRDGANKKMFDDIKADIASLEYDTDGDTFKKIVLSRLSSQTWFEALQDNK